MSSSHDDVWHCKEEDCYVCTDNNSFPEVPDFPLTDKMLDDVFQAMKVVEEANERDSERIHTLNQRAYNLAKQVNEKGNGLLKQRKRSNNLRSGLKMQIRSR